MTSIIQRIPTFHVIMKFFAFNKYERENPLRTGFQKIWDVLGNEIMSVPGLLPTRLLFRRAVVLT